MLSNNGYIDEVQHGAECTLFHIILCLHNFFYDNFVLISATNAVDIAKLIISKHPPMDTMCVKGKTPLHYVLYMPSRHGSKDNKSTTAEQLTELLLEGGADPKKASIKHNDEPCLHKAAESGSPHLVQMLLKHGVDVNECTRKKQNALHATWRKISGRS